MHLYESKPCTELIQWLEKHHACIEREWFAETRGFRVYTADPGDPYIRILGRGDSLTEALEQAGFPVSAP
jgi:hypothetical protein